MAEAYGKLTGRPGICMVTRGPGATHASVGVHTAMQDSTPMLLLVGQVARGMRGREAFQEVDYEAMFAPLAKWACEVESAARIPELLAQAFTVATSGRPGRSCSRCRRTCSPRRPTSRTRRPRPVQAHPGADDLARLRELLAGAERPLVLVGGRPWNDAAARRPRGVLRGERAARRRRLPLPGSRRQPRRRTWGTSASGSTRGSPSACGRPTCCSSSARGWAR